MSVNALIKQARACVARVRDAERMAKEHVERWQARTGRVLIDLKAQCDHGQWRTALQKIGIPKSTAHEWMQQAGSMTALREQRERKRKAQTTHRRKRPLRNGHLAPRGAVVIDTSMPVTLSVRDSREASDHKRWKAQLAALCGEIIAQRAYWDKHIPGWQHFRMPTDLRTLARQALEELMIIANGNQRSLSDVENNTPLLRGGQRKR